MQELIKTTAIVMTMMLKINLCLLVSRQTLPHCQVLLTRMTSSQKLAQNGFRFREHSKFAWNPKP